MLIGLQHEPSITHDTDTFGSSSQGLVGRKIKLQTKEACRGIVRCSLCFGSHLEDVEAPVAASVPLGFWPLEGPFPLMYPLHPPQQMRPQVHMEVRTPQVPVNGLHKCKSTWKHRRISLTKSPPPKESPGSGFIGNLVTI